MKNAPLESETLLCGLSCYFCWDRRRIQFLSEIILALFKTATVNGSKWVLGIGGPVYKESKYRRFQRFFAQVSFDFNAVARCIVHILDLTNKQMTLSLDRTNWKFGQLEINFLVLSVTFEGSAVPLFWALLNHRGNSNFEQRRAIINRFIRTFGKTCIAVLIADREFLSKQTLDFLKENRLPFCFRVKSNYKMTNKKGKKSKISRLFSGYPKGFIYHDEKPRRMWGHKVFVTGVTNHQGSLVVVIRDRPSAQKWEALDEYKLRWKIEDLFAFLKKSGFDLESTHFNKRIRLKKLMAVIAIATAWAVKTGLMLNDKRPIHKKTHKRKALSIFRYGLELIRMTLLNPFSKPRIEGIPILLSCT